MQTLKRSCNRNRQQHRPDDPSDINHELMLEHIPDNFLVADIRVSEARHIVFATTKQLKLLAHSKNWFMDGTFQVNISP